MYYNKIEFKIPVFFGWLGSLLLSALFVFHWLDLNRIEDVVINEIIIAEETQSILNEENDEIYLSEYTQTLEDIEQEKKDLILTLFNMPEARERVIGFFAEISNSFEIAEIILTNAAAFDIPPALAFALGWEESRLNPRAVNNKNRDQSIDRGLFQLNSRSFPRLDLQSFFNPHVNSWHGMSHLRYCLDTGGSEIVALAMYNAGAGRVQNTGTPRSTLDYIGRIFKKRQGIEDQFREMEKAWFLQIEEKEDFHNLAEVAEEGSLKYQFTIKPLTFTAFSPLKPTL